MAQHHHHGVMCDEMMVADAAVGLLQRSEAGQRPDFPSALHRHSKSRPNLITSTKTPSAFYIGANGQKSEEHLQERDPA